MFDFQYHRTPSKVQFIISKALRQNSPHYSPIEENKMKIIKKISNLNYESKIKFSLKIMSFKLNKNLEILTKSIRYDKSLLINETKLFLPEICTSFLVFIETL
jgi:hypothetical protein